MSYFSTHNAREVCYLNVFRVSAGSPTLMEAFLAKMDAGCPDIVDLIICLVPGKQQEVY